MRTIIAGTRTLTDFNIVLSAIKNSTFIPTVILSGGARGVDSLGELYANINDIPLEKYPANWDLYGKSAGYKRNVLMAEHADSLIAIWDGKSLGTKHMIDIAKKKNLRVYIEYT